MGIKVYFLFHPAFKREYEIILQQLRPVNAVDRRRQLNENPDDGSGFIVWLDGYNRQYSVTKKSILGSDKDIQNFIDACKQRPDDRMIDVLRDSLPK